jgi:hypothetical protein
MLEVAAPRPINVAHELIVQGKPAARRGRKARGLADAKTARLPALHTVDPAQGMGRDKESPEMKQGPTAGRGKRVVLSLFACACIVAGSPAAAATAAGGAQKPVSATHGDCKNDNAGQHNGYVCPDDETGGTTETGGGVEVIGIT